MLGAWFTLRMGTKGCRLVLLEGCGSRWGDAVVGKRAICLDFLPFLSPRDDDVACIAPNVDDTTEIVVGVVVVDALLFLKAVSKALTPERPLLVELVMTFVEIFCWMLLVQLDGDGHRWRRRRSR